MNLLLMSIVFYAGIDICLTNSLTPADRPTQETQSEEPWLEIAQKTYGRDDNESNGQTTFFTKHKRRPHTKRKPPRISNVRLSRNWSPMYDHKRLFHRKPLQYYAMDKQNEHHIVYESFNEHEREFQDDREKRFKPSKVSHRQTQDLLGYDVHSRYRPMLSRNVSGPSARVQSPFAQSSAIRFMGNTADSSIFNVQSRALRNPVHISPSRDGKTTTSLQLDTDSILLQSLQLKAAISKGSPPESEKDVSSKLIPKHSKRSLRDRMSNIWLELESMKQEMEEQQKAVVSLIKAQSPSIVSTTTKKDVEETFTNAPANDVIKPKLTIEKAIDVPLTDETEHSTVAVPNDLESNTVNHVEGYTSLSFSPDWSMPNGILNLTTKHSVTDQNDINEAHQSTSQNFMTEETEFSTTQADFHPSDGKSMNNFKRLQKFVENVNRDDLEETSPAIYVSGTELPGRDVIVLLHDLDPKTFDSDMMKDVKRTEVEDLSGSILSSTDYQHINENTERTVKETKISRYSTQVPVDTTTESFPDIQNEFINYNNRELPSRFQKFKDFLVGQKLSLTNEDQNNLAFSYPDVTVEVTSFDDIEETVTLQPLEEDDRITWLPKKNRLEAFFENSIMRTHGMANFKEAADPESYLTRFEPEPVSTSGYYHVVEEPDPAPIDKFGKFLSDRNIDVSQEDDFVVFPDYADMPLLTESSSSENPVHDFLNFLASQGERDDLDTYELGIPAETPPSSWFRKKADFDDGRDASEETNDGNLSVFLSVDSKSTTLAPAENPIIVAPSNVFVPDKPSFLPVTSSTTTKPDSSVVDVIALVARLGNGSRRGDSSLPVTSIANELTVSKDDVLLNPSTSPLTDPIPSSSTTLHSLFVEEPTTKTASFDSIVNESVPALSFVEPTTSRADHLTIVTEVTVPSTEYEVTEVPSSVFFDLELTDLTVTAHSQSTSDDLILNTMTDTPTELTGLTVTAHSLSTSDDLILNTDIISTSTPIIDMSGASILSTDGSTIVTDFMPKSANAMSTTDLVVMSTADLVDTSTIAETDLPVSISSVKLFDLTSTTESPTSEDWLTTEVPLSSQEFLTTSIIVSTSLPVTETTILDAFGVAGEVEGPKVTRISKSHDHVALAISTAVACLALLLVFIGIAFVKKVAMERKKTRYLVQPRYSYHF